MGKALETVQDTRRCTIIIQTTEESTLKEILAHINTDKNEQKKGERGYEK